MKTTTRNYGIDLLRIVSMLAVVTMHVLGHGGAISESSTPINTMIVNFLESLCSAAVNCFVLISGFVCFRNENYYPKLRNLINLLIVVSFYSLIIASIMKIIYPDQIGFSALLYSFLPVSNDKYWFFTAYFAMFILSPMINLFVHKANQKMIILSVIVVFFFGIYEVFSDPFLFNRGFNFVWLVFLYTIGAIIKKQNLFEKISNRMCLICIAISVIITWLPKFLTTTIWVPVFNFTIYNKMFDSYCSPTTLLMAIATICLFAKIKISANSFVTRVIALLSNSAFSVYLIHDSNEIRNFFIRGKFRFLTNANPFVMLIEIISIVIGIYLVCTLIDQARIYLFKLLKIEKISKKIELFVKFLFGKISNRLPFFDSKQ
jgi:surface polysaccharide O-acyltransferase-like enzyme